MLEGFDDDDRTVNDQSEAVQLQRLVGRNVEDKGATAIDRAADTLLLHGFDVVLAVW